MFQPFGTDFEVQSLSVYDRWGGLVYRGITGWDGGRAGQGVYAYQLAYKDLLSLQSVTLSGEVTLVR